MCASGIITKRCWPDNIKVEFKEITKVRESEAMHSSTKKKKANCTHIWGKYLNEKNKKKSRQTNNQGDNKQTSVQTLTDRQRERETDRCL